MKPKPRRVAARENPDLWAETEEMTLEEAASLMFPCGLYTASTLRSAARAGLLETSLLMRKLTTNKRAVREMLENARRPARKRK